MKIIIRRTKMKFIGRFVIGAILFIIGFATANSYYFDQYPLFGVPFLAEILISWSAAAFGFYLIPKYIMAAKKWLEDLVMNVTYNMVTDFWNEYTKRLEKNRKIRQKEQKKKSKKKNKDKLLGGIILDTSVLIDGRLLEIIKSGFIMNPLIVPNFVITELHLLADNDDVLKRKKGRRGLDLINLLKKHTKVIVFGAKSTNIGADKEIIKMAKEYKLPIMTLDFNLNKVAKVSNIKVLNINELAEALKPEFIPGDKLDVKVVSEGSSKNQGVAYLKDGTMIVVENGKKLVGEEVTVTVSKLLQSPAGKMVFAEPEK